MSIKLLQPVLIAGIHTPADGATLTLTAALEADLVGGGRAQWISPPATQEETGQQFARYALDSSGNPVGLYGPDGELLMEFVDVGGSSASATVEV